MTYLQSEVFKVIFVVGLVAASWGSLKLAFQATRHDLPLRLSLAALLSLLALLQSFLYTMLAFPGMAQKMWPLQETAIWLYGPFLLIFAHFLLHIPLTPARALLFCAPSGLFVLARLTTVAMGAKLPDWWVLANLLQAVVFLLIAAIWGKTRWKQVHILVSAYMATRYYWLALLIAGLLALLLADLFIHWSFFSQRQLSLVFLYSLSATVSAYTILIALILVVVIHRKSDDSDEPRNATEMPSPEPVPFVEESVPESPAGSRRTELTDEAAKELAGTLRSLVENRQVYSRNDLSLGDLAAMLGVSVHVASELLNHHMNTSFYEFLNVYRVEEAARLLGDPACRRSITEIAYEAGFNNPNTFYRTFRNRFNTTPARYRRDLKASVPESGVPAED